jgi:hypothetical protein
MLIETGAGSLNLTLEEKRVFGQLFRQADTEGIGVVTGEVAVKFFEKTRLEPAVLGEVCTGMAPLYRADVLWLRRHTRGHYADQ